MGAPSHLRISQSDDGNNPSRVQAAATLSTTYPTFTNTPLCSNDYTAGALQAEGVTAPVSLTQRLLLWQISQLTYICGSVCIELPQLISTANSLFGFFCDTGQPVLDALVDEAGDWGYIVCRSGSAAAAIEAAAENMDIDICGVLIRIHSLRAANLMNSTPHMQQVTGNWGQPAWEPCAAYVAYPNHYPPVPHSRLPEDCQTTDAYNQSYPSSQSAGLITEHQNKEEDRERIQVTIFNRHAGDNSMDHRRAAGSYPTAAAPSSAVGAAPPGSDALTPHAFTPTLTGLTAPLGGVSSPPDADALLPASHYTLMGPKVVKRLTGFFDGPVTGVCPEQLCLDTEVSQAPVAAAQAHMTLPAIPQLLTPTLLTLPATSAQELKQTKRSPVVLSLTVHGHRTTHRHKSSAVLPDSPSKGRRSSSQVRKGKGQVPHYSLSPALSESPKRHRHSSRRSKTSKRKTPPAGLRSSDTGRGDCKTGRDGKQSNQRSLSELHSAMPPEPTRPGTSSRDSLAPTSSPSDSRQQLTSADRRKHFTEAGSSSRGQSLNGRSATRCESPREGCPATRPKKGALHERILSPGSSDPNGSAMGDPRVQQISKFQSKYSRNPKSPTSHDRRPPLQTGKSSRPTRKRSLSPASSASPSRGRHDTRSGKDKKKRRRHGRSPPPAALPSRHKRAFRSSQHSREEKSRRQGLSPMHPVSPGRGKLAASPGMGKRNGVGRFSLPRRAPARPVSPGRDQQQHLSSTGRRRMGLFLPDNNAIGLLCNQPARKSPDDPSPISGIHGRDLPSRQSYRPIRYSSLPFIASQKGRYQPVPIQHGDRHDTGTRLIRQALGGLHSLDNVQKEDKSASRNAKRQSSPSPDRPPPENRHKGFSSLKVRASTKRHKAAKATKDKTGKAHRKKSDRPKLSSSHHHKHIKAQTKDSHADERIKSEHDSGLLLDRRSALTALQDAIGAGRSKLPPQQQQHHPGSHLRASPISPAQAQQGVAAEHPDQASLSAKPYLNSSPASNLQTPLQLAPAANCFSKTTPLTALTPWFDQPGSATARHGVKPALQSAHFPDSPTDGTHGVSIQAISKYAGGMQCADIAKAVDISDEPLRGGVNYKSPQLVSMHQMLLGRTQGGTQVCETGPVTPTPACIPDVGTQNVSWSEFRSTHLQFCTEEFYTAQGWSVDRDLGTEERAMLQEFQQQVFQMVNMTLTGSDA